MSITSIIMPFFNRWDLSHARLSELYKYIPPYDVEIILVDDASADKDVDGGVAFWQKSVAKHVIRYIKLEKNLGFGGAMNAGAAKAKGDFLILLSNDVVISGDFVTEIVTRLIKDNSLLIGGEVIYGPAGWNEFEFDRKRTIVPYANGWLLACTKELWNAVGGFDPRWGRFDYEDVDLSLSATRLGYNLSALNSSFVKHIGGATVNAIAPDRYERTKRNREIFIDKWQEYLRTSGV